MPDAARLAIVIVSFNVARELADCLAALPAAVGRLEATVTVVDNGSVDDVRDMLTRDWPSVRLIETGENLGFARANNVGIRRTEGELVLLLNPDTVPRPGSLARLAALLDERRDVVAVGPRLVDAGGAPELSFGWPMSPAGELRQKVVQGLARRGVGPMQRWLARALVTPAAHPWVSGACLLVRRGALEQAGLFDERFFMYAEDVDLCLALGRLGLVWFEPSAEVVHLGGRSGPSNPALARRRRDSQLAYYRKHHPRWAPLLRLYLRLKGA